MMIKTFKLEKEKVFVFPNGVDTKRFRPDIKSDSLRRNLEAQRKKIMLFIGLMRKERGLALFMKAMPRIVAGYSDFVVFFVGEGPRKSELERLTRDLGMQQFVKFLKFVGHNEIPKYVCMCDIALGPLATTIDTFGCNHCGSWSFLF